MKKLFVLSFVLFVACSQQKSPRLNNNVNTTHTAGATAQQTSTDTLQLNITDTYVTGQFNYRSDSNFVEIAPLYGYKDIYLRKATYRAFKKMYESALEDGIRLKIVSGTRNYEHQKRIWEGKWKRFNSDSELEKALKILNFSSMPMTSRHHWGTDIDLNNLNNEYFKSGEGLKVYQWLKKNANKFGFYQPYTKKSRNGRTGYNMEKWHWSYMPLADKFLSYYNKHITDKDISGFLGSNLAANIGMVEKYVNGLSVKIKNYGK